MKKIILLAATLFWSMYALGQSDKQVTRMAVLTIDLSKLRSYMTLLKVQMETAVRLEPGVISYKVYADKQNPARLTLIEVYADNASYLRHRETPHFKKYKNATADMVKSLELTEVQPVLSTQKKSNKN